MRGSRLRTLLLALALAWMPASFAMAEDDENAEEQSCVDACMEAFDTCSDNCFNHPDDFKCGDGCMVEKAECVKKCG